MRQRKLIRIGTRGSRLALVQAEVVRNLLRREGHDGEIVIVRTSGDRIRDRPLADAGGKGLFTKELEEALFAGEADIAVHSMKDVPTHLPGGLALGAFLPREDPRDVLVCNESYTLASLPHSAIVGTSSVRRRAQLLRARKDIEVITLRGNVDTRLSRVEGGAITAAILALAGLKRIGLHDRAATIFEPDEWLPSPAQGAIGIELRSDDDEMREIVAKLNHQPTAIELACERAFLAELDGSCRTPIAALATLEGQILTFRGEVLAPDGSNFVETAFAKEIGTHPIEDAAFWGKEAGAVLRPNAMQWLDI